MRNETCRNFYGVVAWVQQACSQVFGSYHYVYRLLSVTLTDAQLDCGSFVIFRPTTLRPYLNLKPRSVVRAR